MNPGADPIALGLPHRAPFIFVDAVLALEPGVSASARRIFPGDDPVFRGHFPGDPIVPGVLLTEALAQTAGLAAGQGSTPLRLSAIRGMKFPAAALPGEEITLTARHAGGMAGLWQFEVEAAVAGRVVATGVVVLSAAP